MKPTRDGFGEALVELGAENRDVVVLSADLTESTRAIWFKEKYPDRFICVGVAEQDMFSTAAGLALSGKIPFACTFGVFASGRAWDQLRMSVASMNLNVKIVGSHGGITVGADGASHQALEELSLLRPLPNMTIIVPADSSQAKKATHAAAKWRGPVYLRLGRNPVPTITDDSAPFEIGKANVLMEGNDVTIIACGLMVHASLSAAEALAGAGIRAQVVNLHTIKPIDEEVVIRSARKTGCIVTAEEHTLAGGMGSAVAEVVVQGCPVPMEMVAVRDRFGISGEPEELLKEFHLTSLDIEMACRKVIGRK